MTASESNDGTVAASSSFGHTEDFKCRRVNRVAPQRQLSRDCARGSSPRELAGGPPRNALMVTKVQSAAFNFAQKFPPLGVGGCGLWAQAYATLRECFQWVTRSRFAQDRIGTSAPSQRSAARQSLSSAVTGGAPGCPTSIAHHTESCPTGETHTEDDNRVHPDVAAPSASETSAAR